MKELVGCRYIDAVISDCPTTLYRRYLYNITQAKYINWCKKKVKWSRYRPVWPRGWVEVELYSSMTAALEGCEWSAARPGRTLPPRKTRCPFYRRLGGPQGRSGREENLVPTGIRSRTIQPVVSRYTDWATGPTIQNFITVLNNNQRYLCWNKWIQCIHTHLTSMLIL
jgi:hypothetical protein